MAKVHQETWQLCNVVTGDQSWFYHKQIGRKSSNTACTLTGGSPPTVARRIRFGPGSLFCIFFQMTGSVLIHHVDRGGNIDHRYSIGNCLEPLIEEIRKQ